MGYDVGRSLISGSRLVDLMLTDLTAFKLKRVRARWRVWMLDAVRSRGRSRGRRAWSLLTLVRLVWSGRSCRHGRAVGRRGGRLLRLHTELQGSSASCTAPLLLDCSFNCAFLQHHILHAHRCCCSTKVSIVASIKASIVRYSRFSNGKSLSARALEPRSLAVAVPAQHNPPVYPASQQQQLAAPACRPVTRELGLGRRFGCSLFSREPGLMS